MKRLFVWILFVLCLVTTAVEDAAASGGAGVPAAAATVVAVSSEAHRNHADVTVTVNPGGQDTQVWLRVGSTVVTTCSDAYGSRAPASGGVAAGAGAADTDVLITANGLTPLLVHYVCVLAQNASGTTIYGPVSFFTPDAPGVITTIPSNVGGRSASLNALVNPNRAQTSGWFRYDTVSPGSCNDTFGTRFPVTAIAVGQGSTQVGMTRTVTGLEPGTTYYVCAVAQSAEGTVFGGIQQFTTRAEPTVTTGAASAVTWSGASLAGTATPNFTETRTWFRYGPTDPGTCSDAFGLSTPQVSIPSSSNSPQDFSATVSGLSPTVTYYYCAVAENSGGRVFGTVRSFTTTPAPPTVLAASALSVRSTTATFRANVNAGGGSTTVWFRYATTDPGTCAGTFGTRVPAASGVSGGSALVPIDVDLAVTGLVAETTYFVCAYAQNVSGTGEGSVFQLTTAGPPAVVTVAPSPVGATAATLNGTGMPNRVAGTGWFRVATTSPGACNDTFGTRVPESGGADVGSGTAAVPFASVATGLSEVTTYYACAIVETSEGKAFGGVVSFVTTGHPTVTTEAASDVAANTATLAGTVNPNGAATSTWFRYDVTDPGACSDTWGMSTASTEAGAGRAALPTSQGVSGLQAATTYYYCAIASNDVGTSFGPVLTFTTEVSAPTVVTTEPTSVGPTSASLRADVDPNGLSTLAWFRFDTVDPGACDDTFGTRAPATGSTDVGGGADVFDLVEPVALVDGTTYYFCAIAENSAGRTFGDVRAFTTPKLPTAEALPPMPRNSTSATLQARGNPGGTAATGWFRYGDTDPGTCADDYGTRVPAVGSALLGAGLDDVDFGQAVPLLSRSTTYWVCAFVQNEVGTVASAPLAFTTPFDELVVETVGARLTSTSSALLDGRAIPNGSAAEGWFRYSATDPGACSDSFGTRAPASGGTELGQGLTSVEWSEPVSGLAIGTTYYACAIGKTDGGVAFGEVFAFTTTAAPLVTTEAAEDVTGATATLAATVNPSNGATTGWFRYSPSEPLACDDTFGVRAPASGGVDLGSAAGAVALTVPVTGLDPDTTYYVCAIAENAVGLRVGEVVPFTSAAAPVVTTESPLAVTGVSATLAGYVLPRRSPSVGWFRYSDTPVASCTDDFGTRVPAAGGIDVGGGSALAPLSFDVEGLSPGATYWYCAFAENDEGAAAGEVVSFLTSSTPTVSTFAAVSVTPTSATLSGAANPNGQSTGAWFRMSTVHPGACDDSFGTRLPDVGGSSLGGETSPVPFTHDLTGLSPGTTYHVCAIAQNSAGVAVGVVRSFSTPGAPLVATQAATAVTGSSGTLHGAVTPRGLATTAWFRWSTTDPVACSDTFGARVPDPVVDVGAGASSVALSHPLTGITAGTTVYYCAIAQNSEGLRFGELRTFTTSATLPIVSTSAASDITLVGATLKGSVNPVGAPATAWFRISSVGPGVCNDTFGTRVPSAGGVAIAPSASGVAFSQAASGLSPGTVYYYCAIAQNAAGKAFGEVRTLVTQDLPAATTLAPASVTSVAVTLAGAGNPNEVAAIGWFRWSTTSPGACNDTFGFRAPSLTGLPLGNGSADVGYTQVVTGLSPRTTYYYCAIVGNTAGTAYGEVVSFTTPGAPSVTFTGVSGVTTTDASLAATGRANGAATTGWFRYGTTPPGACNDTFGVRTPSSGGTALGTGDTDVPFTAALTGLVPGTTYHVCAVVQSNEGKVFSTLSSFTTFAPPLVTTGAATLVGATSATIGGSGSPRGTASVGWFRFGSTDPGVCSDAFGTRVPLADGTALGATGTTAFTAPVTGLTAATTYWFCAVASNAYGTTYGTPVSFRTAAPPTVATLAPTDVASTTATFRATVNPAGGATTAWFRWSATSPGACSDAFGTRVPLAGVSAGSGTADVPVSAAVTGLPVGTRLYVCALASNDAGTVFGSVLSFDTTAAPTVTTEDPVVASTSATLHGLASPSGQATTAWFRYATTAPASCNDSFGTRAPVSGGAALGAGSSPVAFQQAISGLTPGRTYYACAIASNASGTGFGTVRAFTTLEAPVVSTVSAVATSSSGATLSGTVDPNGSAGLGWFRFASSNPGACNDSFGTRAPATGGVDVGAGDAPVAFEQSVAGLTPGATYWVCALGSNAVGTRLGSLVQLVLPAAPTVVTGTPTGVGAVAATLTATVTANRADTGAWFRVSATNPVACTDDFGTRVPATGTLPVGAGTSAVAVTSPVTGLTATTSYYVCAFAQNVAGARAGAVVSFSTTADLPAVTTLDADAVVGTNATLHGEASPNGAATTAWFRYSTTSAATCSDAFGVQAPSVPIPLGSGLTPVPFQAPLTNLLPRATVYFCAVARSARGTSYGEIRSFTAGAVAPLVGTFDAEDITAGEATLVGAGNPQGSATTAWFRIGDTNPGTCNGAWGTRVPASGGTDLGSGYLDVDFDAPASGLASGTEYWVCAFASNQGGTAVGAPVSFRTDAEAPDVHTAAAVVSTTDVTLHGSADPNGAEAMGWFRVGSTDPGVCSDAFGVRWPDEDGLSLGAGRGDVPFELPVAGLAAGTYWVCALAENDGGVGLGEVLSFEVTGDGDTDGGGSDDTDVPVDTDDGGSSDDDTDGGGSVDDTDGSPDDGCACSGGGTGGSGVGLALSAMLLWAARGRRRI